MEALMIERAVKAIESSSRPLQHAALRAVVLLAESYRKAENQLIEAEVDSGPLARLFKLAQFQVENCNSLYIRFQALKVITWLATSNYFGYLRECIGRELVKHVDTSLIEGTPGCSLISY